MRDPFRGIPFHLICQQPGRQPRALRKPHQPHELAAILLYHLLQHLPHAPLVLLRGRAVGVQPAVVRLAVGEGGEDAGAGTAVEGAVDEDELEGGSEGPLEAAGLDFEYQGGGAAAVEAEQAGEVLVGFDHCRCSFSVR